MSLSTKIQKTLGIHPKTFLTYDAEAIQALLAPTLRKQAIKHLRLSDGVVAKSFRGEYIQSGLGHPHAFLDKQAKNGTWGTYLEATALGEQLGCNIIVTPVRQGVTQEPICLYRADSKKAKTIHLYNSNNTHWYVDNKTKGDGNCLYNACAQALQTHVQAEFPQTPVSTASQTNLFKIKLDMARSIEQQQRILHAIQQQPTPQEHEATFNQEQERIRQLTPEEQQQIIDDHQYALKLAYDDMGYTQANPTDLKTVLEESALTRGHAQRTI